MCYIINKILNIIMEINRSISIPNIIDNEIIGIESPCFSMNNIKIYNTDILKFNALLDNSVDLIVTSPPYNLDIQYGSNDDNLNYDDYLSFTVAWLEKCYNLSKNDGRICLNIPLDKNKGGQQSVYSDITSLAKKVGWKYKTTIIWNEGNISRRTAWGSYMSASAPYVIAPVEIILVLYKQEWKKQSGSKISDISKNEFIEWTNGIWTFNGESKKKVGHPAPFPIELPKRCIKLFSYVGDTIFDPFVGSGTTLIAAELNNREGIGVDIDKHYCGIAINRIKKETNLYQKKLIKDQYV